MRNQSTLREDDRAIEGLPIRLIIALVVGVASLALMMGMLDGFGGGLQDEELDAEIEPGVTEAGDKEITITVVDENGQTVEGAKIVIKSGTAEVDGGSRVLDPSNDGDGVPGQVTLQSDFTNDEVDLNNQDQGKIIIEIIVPSDGNYKNDKADGGIVIVA